MSIIKTRSFLEKSGCGWITSIVIGIVFVIGIIAYGGGGRGYSGDPNASEAPAVEFGNLTVTRGVTQALIGEEGNGAQMDIQQKFQRYSSAVSSITQVGYGNAAAEEMGVRVGNDDVERGIQRQIDMLAEQYAPMLGLKSAEEFKKSPQGGQMVQRFNEYYTKLKKAPGGQDYLRAQFAVGKMQEMLEKDVSVTDEQLKHGSDQLSFRTISINPVAGKTEEVQKTADAIAEEVKKDGFAKVAEKYGKPSASYPGVIASTSPQSMSRTQLETMPEAEALGKLKAGETSGALTTGQGRTIYHLVEVKQNVPKDFDKQKSMLRKGYVQMKASEAMSKRVEAAKKKIKVVWHDKGLEAISILLQTAVDYKGCMEVVEKAIEADATPGSDPTATSLARYEAVERAWMIATPKQKKDMREERAEALEGALGLVEDHKIRMDLTDLYIDLKNGKGALTVLEVAADIAEKEADFKEVDTRIQKLLAEKLLTQKDLSDIEATKKRRREELAKDAAEEAQIKKEQAAEDKAEAKRAEETKKAKESAKTSDAKKSPEPEKTGNTAGTEGSEPAKK